MAAGYGYQGYCYATKAEALTAFCRGEFPRMSFESDVSVSANTWSGLAKVLSCQSVTTGTDTLNLWWNRPGQTGATLTMKLDQWPACDTDSNFSAGDAMAFGWAIAGVWIFAAALLHMRNGL